MTPYGRLVALAHRERELVEQGRDGELAALDAERAALLASLPEQAPASAAGELAELVQLVEGTSALLAARLAEVGAELRAVQTSRRAARAYGDAAPASRIAFETAA
jgi:hypothetical protein